LGTLNAKEEQAMNEEEQQNGWSRREWLLASAASAGALWLGGAKAAIAKGVARDDVPADLTPAQALQRLLDGNKRFASGKPKGPHRSLARVHELAANQSPFAAILSCADSRVPVEILFDQGFGDLFVVRNAGNVATTEEFASLEFGTLVLGAKVLLVLGHSSCGAVKASIAGEPVPGQISVLYQHIRPAVNSGGGDLAKTTADNVRFQAATLAQASPVIAELMKQAKLQVAGGVYDLATGIVTPISL
jgi:carbonic anhydrase